MSNNSYSCPGGGEIGRAQVTQAEACGLAPSPDMNPILLKPNSDRGSQVVLDGKVWKTLAAREYYEHFDFLLRRVLDAYERLARHYEYVVIEGAGSLTELNLKSRDLVNLGLARRLDAPGLLVADIDRGGVFASIIGTFCLLDDEEKRLVRSFAVNRFRGDASLFEDGVKILESRTGKTCLGVFPMLHDVFLDAEDGVCLEEAPPASGSGPRVGIVRLPHISNFTDFRLLAPFAEWIARPPQGRFDCVILPGTKNTIGDLAWLRNAGLDDWIVRQSRAGAMVIGVCGGYQMPGDSIEDPHHVESAASEAPGLGMLAVRTVMLCEKTVRGVEAATPSGIRFEGYEIHMGETSRPPGAQPFAMLSDGAPDGIRTPNCVGTYLHGALESAEVLSELLGCPIPPAPPKQESYAQLAAWFDKHAPRFEELYL
jgi:adenosylcobyric acid synthase